MIPTDPCPGIWPVWTPGAQAAGFKRWRWITEHCYTQNMKALGLMGSEKKIFVCFSHCKYIGANCYTQNMKALGLVASEKKIFLNIFPIVVSL